MPFGTDGKTPHCPNHPEVALREQEGRWALSQLIRHGEVHDMPAPSLCLVAYACPVCHYVELYDRHRDRPPVAG